MHERELMTSNLEEAHENARVQIVDAAIRLCAKRGWHKMTVRAIADEAGVNSAMLGYYFKNKDTLAREVIRITTERINKSRRVQLEELHRLHGDIIPVYVLVRFY